MTTLEELFADAEAAEEAEDHEQAAALYQRCLAIDPTTPSPPSTAPTACAALAV